MSDERYQAGLQRLAQIDGEAGEKVLAALGITNIQETKPEQFDALFTQVSALG